MKKLLLFICYLFVTLLATVSASAQTLSALALSSGTLSPTFSPGTQYYSTFVTASTITVIPTASNSDETIYVSVNGGNPSQVNSGSASAPLALNGGENTIEISVTITLPGGMGFGSLYTITVKTPSTLDIVSLSNATPATNAYSLRKLSSTYSGKAINVRRSSDGTALDIGFDADGGLDTAALKNFVAVETVL